MKTAQFYFGPPPRRYFFTARPVADRLGGSFESRESSRSSRSRQPDSTPIFHAPELTSVISSVGGQQEEDGRSGRN